MAFPESSIKLFGHSHFYDSGTFFNYNILLASMNIARFSVILKEGKDPQKCASYRPLSLLNCNYKIITKLLFNRQESVLPKLVKLDQIGLIKRPPLI